MQAHASPSLEIDCFFHLSFAILICLGFGFCVAATGCNRGLSKTDTSTNADIESVIFHGGYITADREHSVGFDPTPLNIPAEHRIQDVQTSCDCVSAKLMTIESNQHKKPILQVTVHPDAKLTGIASLAVELRIKLSNQQSRSAVFEFVHYEQRVAIVE